MNRRTRMGQYTGYASMLITFLLQGCTERHLAPANQAEKHLERVERYLASGQTRVFRIAYDEGPVGDHQPQAESGAGIYSILWQQGDSISILRDRIHQDLLTWKANQLSLQSAAGSGVVEAPASFERDVTSLLGKGGMLAVSCYLEQVLAGEKQRIGNPEVSDVRFEGGKPNGLLTYTLRFQGVPNAQYKVILEYNPKTYHPMARVYKLQSGSDGTGVGTSWATEAYGVCASDDEMKLDPDEVAIITDNIKAMRSKRSQ